MPTHQHVVSKLRVKVGKASLAAELDRLVASAYVEDNLNLPDAFSVSFRDPERTVLARAGLDVGSAVTLAVASDAAPGDETLLAGEVTAVEAHAGAEGTFTVVRGYDQSHRLFRGRVTETYANVTYADVARTVAARAGLAAGRIDATRAVHDHVSQGNATDWQFLWSLARQVGYEVAVVDGKLDFRSPTDSSAGPATGTLAAAGPLQLVLGANLLRIQAVVTAAEQVPEVRVRGWDPRRKRVVVGSAPAEAASAAVGRRPAELAGRFAAPAYVGVDVPYSTQADVDAAARALAEQVAGAAAELEGVARGNPKLRAGAAVSLGLVGEPFDGRYTLTTTRHVFDPYEGYTTWFTVSGRQERSLLGLAGGARAAGAGGAGGGAVAGGVANALVSDVGDPEGLGRVRLTFPWLSDDYVSDWARTAQPSAGPDRGGVFLPEVGDEVLVAFDQGDLRRPYVVGGLHNGVDKPKLGDGLVDGATGGVRRRGFVSKKGHALVFLDGDGDEGVALLTGDRGLRISLNETTTTIKVTSDGAVRIEGARDVTVKAGTALTLEGGASAELKAPRVSIRADGPVEVSGTPIKLN